MREKANKGGLFKKKNASSQSTDLAAVGTSSEVGTRSKKSRRKKKEKKKRSFFGVLWLLIKIGFLLGIIGALVVGGYIYKIIKNAPDIDTSDISALLSQSSYIYDDAGEIIDTTYSSQNRTIVEIGDIPLHVQQAFIALEDRKFYTHHGINLIRMVGAVKESLFGGGEISGTSTITQQLARNVFLTDIMEERSIPRKVTEIYYAILLEQRLTKDQILEGYLNTINFGLGYGIQTVSQTYYSKDVQDLTVAEAAALATLPQAPSYYALVKRIDLEYVEQNRDKLISTDSYYGYVWNDKAEGRMKYCLATMHEMGFIDDATYEEAKATEIKDIVNPNFNAINSYEVNYFADYVIEQVISDLMAEYDYTYSQAYDLVYNGGLRIYTTLNSQAQAVIDKEFADRSNFAEITPNRYDKNGNILYADTNAVLLYKYSSYFDKDGVFTLRNDEYVKNPDGSIKIKYKGRLAFYPVSYNGVNEVNIEFRNMFLWEDDEFYTILGGILSIPRQYKTIDENNDVTVSAQFFTDFPDFFTDDGNGNLSTTRYTLRTKTIQPQVAMTIIDNATGAIKAMSGGRETTGRSLLNRAVSTFQPGSSIKPFTVYGAALQNSYELAAAGKYQGFYETKYDQQGVNLMGNYITCASVFDDEPLTVNGRIWPKNDDSSYSGLVSFRTAIQESINVVAVKICAQVGAEYAFEMSQRFGLESLDPEYDVNYSSMALGGTYSGVTTVQMARATSVYVNGGVMKSVYCYDKVTTRAGAVLLEPNKEEKQIVDPGVAWIMRDVLQSVVTSGTPWRAQISGQRVGGKTGTTDIKENLWFNGFTANYTGSIWMGPDVRVRTNGFGGTYACTLWAKIMKQIPAALGGTYSGKPSNVISVTIDDKSGFLPVDGCETTRTEYFIRGTEPTEQMSLVASGAVCELSGKAATEYCDASHVKYIVGYQRPYIPNEKVKDIKDEVPQEPCDVCDPNNHVAYRVFIDDEGKNLASRDGLLVLIRTADKAFVSFDENGNVILWEKNSNGTIKLDAEGYPVVYVPPVDPEPEEPEEPDEPDNPGTDPEPENPGEGGEGGEGTPEP
ncbi:MAG: transglycosylase domain-containing protein [Clostridia bacterium]|nr:transglycosylase domain-containing protein [Clostridia bacterium]